MQGDSATLSLDRFDFQNVWTTVTGPPDYPKLQFEVDEPPAASPERSLSATEVAPGETLTVTLEVVAQDSSVTFAETLSPQVDSATIESTSVDGTAVSPTVSSAGPSGVDLTVERLSAGQRILAEYSITLADGAADGTTYTITGTVTTDSDITVGSDSFTVRAAQPGGCTVDVTGDGVPVADPDGDGLCEDVNGDGNFDIIDVAEFLDRFDSTAVRRASAGFDFDGSGTIDIIDVSTLLEEL